MSEALEIYKLIEEMYERAEKEAGLAHYQGLPIMEQAARSQSTALRMAKYDIARRYDIHFCEDCGEPFQPKTHDRPYLCIACLVAEEGDPEQEIDAGPADGASPEPEPSRGVE